MSNIESRKAGRGFAIAFAAALAGTAAGAGTVLWLNGAERFTANIASSSSEAPAPTGPCGGKVKYYRNPMGAPDTSPVPKKDSMQMDYIPVCEDEGASEDGNVVKVSLDKVQRLGVRSEAVEERALSRTVRVFATVQYDERRQTVIAPRFGGWIEKLHVNATGDVVTAGQKLFEVYSPELNVLQQEFMLSRGTQGSADNRLRNLDYPESDLERLRRGERPPRTIAVPAPAAGTVIEKMAIEGMRYQPGETLFRIVDTSTMWVLAEVYEQDLAFVKAGDMAKVAVNAWPNRPFPGRVTFIYPGVGKESRTARLRIEVANPDGLLRADMAATVEIEAPIPGRWVAVPDSAVIDSGKRQIVLVERGEGRYEPRPVKLGARVPGYVQVLEGLRPGERVVTSATFLIDAESNLRAALAAFTAGDGK
ncbi:efflux RND transporter periplasmic adaptor subunit [Reyranella sp.]|jgi:Cu(I)/Ag(I) efflux system membrane fusion protein|uniref:efflux RND transporter periplasmic adaptor subunit n=1 Tax=Reyranella sp. TaxID=1929291 RepID=UPI003F705B45